MASAPQRVARVQRYEVALPHTQVLERIDDALIGASGGGCCGGGGGGGGWGGGGGGGWGGGSGCSGGGGGFGGGAVGGRRGRAAWRPLLVGQLDAPLGRRAVATAQLPHPQLEARGGGTALPAEAQRVVGGAEQLEPAEGEGE